MEVPQNLHFRGICSQYDSATMFKTTERFVQQGRLAVNVQSGCIGEGLQIVTQGIQWSSLQRGSRIQQDKRCLCSITGSAMTAKAFQSSDFGPDFRGKPRFRSIGSRGNSPPEFGSRESAERGCKAKARPGWMATGTPEVRAAKLLFLDVGPQRELGAG